MLVRRSQRALGWAAVGLFGLVLLGAAYLIELRAIGNFHIVIPGQLYRSGQPSRLQIDQYAKKYGIKTIINLRGSNPESSWYKAEVAEAKRLGIVHLDFAMSARREPTAFQDGRLIALMKAAQKPLLVHCQAGSDRSGLAAALYLLAIAGMSKSVSAEQLSIRFGHISLPIIPEYAMDRAFEAFVPVVRVMRHVKKAEAN